MARHGGIKDSGEFFVINPTSRKVTVPHAHKSIATVGDHNSQQITFECPQHVDGHDVTLCDRRYITWINVNGEVGHDELQIVEVENGTDGMIYLSWTVRDMLTVAKGIIHFSVHFEDGVEGSDNIVYRWSTATCKDCEILDSVNAMFGAYRIYIDGDTLVFGDYIPVDGETLDLTSCIIPEGTLQISEEGEHDVSEYAYAEVTAIYETPTINVSKNGEVTATANGKKAILTLEKPTIKVSKSGLITATANGMEVTHTLQGGEITNLDSEHIRGGATILGVEGIFAREAIFTCDVTLQSPIQNTISNYPKAYLTVAQTGYTRMQPSTFPMMGGIPQKVAIGSIIAIVAADGTQMHPFECRDMEIVSQGSGFKIAKITGENPYVKCTEYIFA